MDAKALPSSNLMYDSNVRAHLRGIIVMATDEKYIVSTSVCFLLLGSFSRNGGQLLCCRTYPTGKSIN